MQAFNLYYAPKDIGIYIGLFYVKEVSWKRLSKEECLDEFKEIERLTRELYQLDSRLMESPSLKEGTQNEVCSMLASSMHVTLTPLFPKLSDLNYDRPWKQFDVSIKDFCHPKIAVEKANLTSELGFYENAVGSVEDLLELCAGTMEFLTPEAKQRIFPGLPKSFPGTTFVPGTNFLACGTQSIMTAAGHPALLNACSFRVSATSLSSILLAASCVAGDVWRRRRRPLRGLLRDGSCFPALLIRHVSAALAWQAVAVQKSLTVGSRGGG